jgi:hypothetical protein
MSCGAAGTNNEVDRLCREKTPRRKGMAAAAIVCFAGSFTAFAFLAYTLRNLHTLGIGFTHPRVLVEAGLGVLFLAGGLLLWYLARS